MQKNNEVRFLPEIHIVGAAGAGRYLVEVAIILAISPDQGAVSPPTAAFHGFVMEPSPRSTFVQVLLRRLYRTPVNRLAKGARPASHASTMREEQAKPRRFKRQPIDPMAEKNDETPVALGIAIESDVHLKP
jgi:hypothetical protein